MVVAQVNREELAWAAGFFDGEGCCTSQKGSRNPTRSYPKIHVAQSGEKIPEVLLRFQEVMKPATMKIYGVKSREGCLPGWQLRASGLEMVQFVIARMWPWLGEVKREQASKVLREANYLPRSR